MPPEIAKTYGPEAFEVPQSAVSNLSPEDLFALKLEALMNDPDSRCEQIAKLVAREMIRVQQAMNELFPLAWTESTSTLLTSRIKNLRFLCNLALDEKRRQTNDRIDVCSPAFQVAFRFISEVFINSLKKSGLDDEPIQKVMLAYRDAMVNRTADLTRWIAEAGRDK
ncbi:MAG TPA: hypothetical protein VII23_13455 [Terriglobales bacterium]